MKKIRNPFKVLTVSLIKTGLLLAVKINSFKANKCKAQIIRNFNISVFDGLSKDQLLRLVYATSGYFGFTCESHSSILCAYNNFIVLKKDGVRYLLMLTKTPQKCKTALCVDEALLYANKYQCSKIFVVSNQYYSPSVWEQAKNNSVRMLDRSDLEAVLGYLSESALQRSFRQKTYEKVVLMLNN